MSQALAAAEERTLIEARLWQRIAAACKEAELPLDDDAPDFVCAAVTTPAIGVFRMASDPDERPDNEANETDNDKTGLFSSLLNDEE